MTRAEGMTLRGSGATPKLIVSTRDPSPSPRISSYHIFMDRLSSIEAASHIIHDEWMKRNPKAEWNAALHVPYEYLPEEEKEKDRAHVHLVREDGEIRFRDTHAFLKSEGGDLKRALKSSCIIHSPSHQGHF